MAATTSASIALGLAHEIDAMLAHHWDGGAVIALMATGESRPTLVPLRGDTLLSLRDLPAARTGVACLSSLGYATDLRGSRGERTRIRVTIAVRCCAAITLIRHIDGRVSCTQEIEGELLDGLRRLVEHPASGCAQRQP